MEDPEHIAAIAVKCLGAAPPPGFLLPAYCTYISCSRLRRDCGKTSGPAGPTPSQTPPRYAYMPLLWGASGVCWGILAPARYVLASASAYSAARTARASLCASPYNAIAAILVHVWAYLRAMPHQSALTTTLCALVSVSVYVCVCVCVLVMYVCL